MIDALAQPQNDEAAAHAMIDALDRAILERGQLVDQPTEHLFLPGLYVRRVLNPAGSLVTTKTHKTEHPFVLLSGVLWVRALDGSVERMVAPRFGVTPPGTRRVLYAETDVVFLTIHPNPDDGQDLDAIEERLIERRELEPGATAHELFRAAFAAQELPE